MAEMQTQAIEDLTSKESSGISNNDTLLVINSSEGGYQATTQNLGDHMIQNARSNLNGKTQTVASAIGEVAGKLPSNNGTNDQILRSNGDGTSRWDNAASASEIGAAVTEWLEENIAGGQTIAIDDSLTVEDAAADAKAVGDALDAVDQKVTDLKSDLDAFVYPNLDDILKKKIVLTKYGSLNTNTGNEVDSTIVLRSAFIPITESTVYNLKIKNNTNQQLDIHALFYDAAQTYISGAIWISGNSVLAYSTVTLTFTTKASASYLRLRLRSYPSGTLIEKENVILCLWTGDDEQIVYASDLEQLNDNALMNKGNITTPGLDLSAGDFIHPGMWYVNAVSYLPKNCPTTKRCRIVSFASSTDNPIGTYQIVIDSDYNIFTRYNNGLTGGGWSNWRNATAYHSNAFECLFTNPTPFQNDYVINRLNKSETNRVSKLYALYDAVTESGVTITKDTLGKDATNTFDIYNYKVSLNTGEKPVVLVICGEHGDELTSAYLGYYLYVEIVKGALKKYLRYVDFWVVPLMNPYGYENATRNNGNGVNLNRDFPALWEYSASSHNKTGDYSLSQTETQIIYNLLVNNKDKILFICNKHDTGSITSKITSSQEDIVAYVSTVLGSDHIVNNGITIYENQQVRETDQWIIDDCITDISHMTLIASRTVATPGSLDVFANSIGIHGSLLEVSGSAYYTGESQIYPAGQFRYKELARLGLDFFVNYIATTIEKNAVVLENDNLVAPIKYYTREQVDGEWQVVEQYWNGSQLLDV